MLYKYLLNNFFFFLNRHRIRMISFIYNHVDDSLLIDDQDINTQQREGLLFKEQQVVHYKVRQDPLYTVINEWNKLPSYMRQSENKAALKGKISNSIVNPSKKCICKNDCL